MRAGVESSLFCLQDYQGIFDAVCGVMKEANDAGNLRNNIICLGANCFITC
jgi:hypothetical protein